MSNYFLIAFVVLLIVAILVTNDATKRGYNGLLWGFIVVLMPMMGLFFYLIFIAISDSNREHNYIVNNNSKHAKNSKIASSNTNINDKPEYTERRTSDQALETDVFCTTCGQQNHFKAEFCKSCGSKIV